MRRQKKRKEKTKGGTQSEFGAREATASARRDTAAEKRAPLAAAGGPQKTRDEAARQSSKRKAEQRHQGVEEPGRKAVRSRVSQSRAKTSARAETTKREAGQS